MCTRHTSVVKDGAESASGMKRYKGRGYYRSQHPPTNPAEDRIGSLRGTLCKLYVQVGSLSRNETGLGRAMPTELSPTLTRTNASSGTDVVSAEERSRARGSYLFHTVAKLPYQCRKPYCRGSYGGNGQVFESTIHGLGFMPAVPRTSRRKLTHGSRRAHPVLLVIGI